MEDSNDISAACRQAADALGILGNLRPGFPRNVVPRLNSSPTVGQTNSEGRAAVRIIKVTGQTRLPLVAKSIEKAVRIAFPSRSARYFVLLP